MKIQTIQDRIEAIYNCGAQPDGTHTRMVFSPEDIQGRALFFSYFEAIGITPYMDAAGNLIARLEGENPDLPAIITGSHLDTVPDGGKFDGVVGCLCGLAVCEELIEKGEKLKHPLEVIVFTDEEGFRFGSGMLGSCSFCGVESHFSEADLDIYGESRDQVMASYGIETKNLEKAKREANSVHCFIELHVEQGASLDKAGLPIGVVSSIAGVSRYEISVFGEANHAGSTKMCDRKDAFVASAKFVAQLPQLVKDLGNDFTVATVGTMKLTPNSVNVIPGKAQFHLEIRDQGESMIREIATSAEKMLREICQEGEFSFEFKEISCHAPQFMAKPVMDAIEAQAQQLGYPYDIMPSGAFHDALQMSECFPTGMIFLPSISGISHAREENTAFSDIEKGANLLLRSIVALDKLEF